MYFFATVKYNCVIFATALVAANRDFSPVVNTWADTDVIMATPLNQLASCNNECCKGVLQLVGINWNIVFCYLLQVYFLTCTECR